MPSKHRARGLNLLLLLPFVACTPSNGGDTETATRAILNGTPDSTNSLFGTVKVNDTTGYCSGSLLTNSWVLTSRHCFAPGTPSVTGDTVIMGTGATAQQQDIVRLVSHPSHFLMPGSQGVDVALVQVAAPFWVTSAGFALAPGDSRGSSTGFTRALFPYATEAMRNGSGNCAGVGPNTSANQNGGVVRTAILPIINLTFDEKDGQGVTTGDHVIYGINSAGQLQLPGDSGGGCFFNVNGTTVLGSVNAASNGTSDSFGPSMRQDVKDWVDQTLFTTGQTPSWGENETPLGVGVSSRGPNTMDIFWTDFFGSLSTIPFDSGYGSKARLGAPAGVKFVQQRRPAAASMAPNRVDVFALGDDGHLWQNTKLDGSWGSWTQRGSRTFTSSPAVASWGPGRLDLFAAGPDGDLLHDAFQDGGWVESWHSVGGIMNGDPAVTSWGPGRLDIIHRGTTGHIYHKAWENGWHPSLDGWNDLGGSGTTSPTITSWGLGRLDIFVFGSGGNMLHRWFEGDWVSDWISFNPFRGQEGEGPADPSGVSWGPGKIDIFTRGGGGPPIWQTQFPR